MKSRLGKWRVGYAGPACPRCAWPIRHEVLREGLQSCNRCGRSFEAVRFEPVEPRAAAPEAVGMGPEGGAPCARHARNTATGACQRCGQFMCSLCRIETDGKTLCPSCFDRLSSEGALASTVTRLRNWRAMSGSCAVLSLLFMFLLIGAPIGLLGIYLAVKGVKDKNSRGETDGVAGLIVLMVVNGLMALGGLIVLLLISIKGFR